MAEEKPNAEREQVEGREVFVTRDDSGVTAVAEEPDAADPRVSTDSERDDDESGEHDPPGDES
jgi:hypothetical protein